MYLTKGGKGIRYMSNHYFTDEQVLTLRQNSNVQTVTRKTITFTPEFKQTAAAKLLSGSLINDILNESGLDPEMIGSGRVYSFRKRVIEEAERHNGFADLRREKHPATISTHRDTVAERLNYLEHELAYTRQEVEFLKKIQQADLEARKAWESKHRLK